MSRSKKPMSSRLEMGVYGRFTSLLCESAVRRMMCEHAGILQAG